MAPYTPTDSEGFDVAEAIQAQPTEGNLGRAKLHAKFKEINPECVLSERRLKSILTSANTQIQVNSFEISQEPGAALNKQEAYGRDSIRTFFIYGPGEFNYGVSANSDMAILITLSQERLAKALKASQTVSKSSSLQTIWDYYTAAAKIAGVPKGMVTKQIEALYGITVELLPISYNECPAQEIEARKAEFKLNSIKLKRQMLKIPEARQYNPVDNRGDPI
jgi:hypothetical protein